MRNVWIPLTLFAAALGLTACQVEEVVQESESAPVVSVPDTTDAPVESPAAPASTLRTATFAVG